VKRPSIPTAHRVALAAGLTGLATLGVGAMSAAAASGSAASPQVAACTTAQLTVWMGIPGGAAAGSTYYELELSDTGTTSCNLIGFPGVSGTGAGAAQLGSSAGWTHSSTPANVILTPGETAHALLQIADVYNFPTSTCEPAAADGLRIYPPNQTTSVVLPYSFEACSAAGPVYLNVDGPITAGAGIPGYSPS
jgi:Protein of unknown function (DUF4232)